MFLEEVYIEQPMRYVVKAHEDTVLKLKKALYGTILKSMEYSDYKYFMLNGLTRCPHEHALYYKVNGNGDVLVVCLYVDDLNFTGNNLTCLRNSRKQSFGNLR